MPYKDMAKSKAYHQEYRKKHPDYILRQKEITKKWMAEHKDYMKEHNKKWCADHKERRKLSSQKWARENRKKHATHSREYYIANREKCLERQRKDRENRKEYYQQYEQKRDKLPYRIAQRRHYSAWRRARKMNAEGSHTFGEWELLKKQYDYTCPSCNRKEPYIVLSEDHIIPLAKGGSDYIENIQPLCRSCNCKKHTKTHKFQLKK